jgi:Protein of unknown function (DUF3365)
VPPCPGWPGVETLRTKFNLVLLGVFSGSLAVTGWLSYSMLQKNARDEVLQNAGIMMEAALSGRGYTVKQVKPLLERQLRRVFLPQSVPAYATTEICNELRSNYAEYTYKEATFCVFRKHMPGFFIIEDCAKTNTFASMPSMQ